MDKGLNLAMNETMARVREKCWPLTKTRWAVLVTILYIGVVVSIRYDALQLIWCGKLNELGDFLAGFFTPLAFLWLVVGYFLQKEELGLQNKELGLQREELKKTGAALGTQVKIMEDRDEVDRQRSMPRLILEKDNSVVRGEGGVEDEYGSTDPNGFILRNIGGPARNLEITIGPDEGGWPEPPPLLDKGKDCPVHISNPFYPSFPDFLNPDTADQPSNDQPTYCRVRFISERHERFEQRWSIRFTGRNSYVEIKPITKDPTPLKDGPAIGQGR